VSGFSLFELLSAQQAGDRDRIYGVVVGVVTNNQDPDKLGRVKVKFPWLSADHESNWARIACPMAGNDRGFFFLPEVDDEVLVAFEHGRVEFPYVVGALYNGKDKPPGDNDDGKNNLRSLKSRSGHTLTLDDTDGKEKIRIVDAKGKESIVFDTAESTITITADKDLTIESKNGKLLLKGAKGIEITSDGGPGKLKVGKDLDVEGGGQVNVKGSTINLN
jgi:uncharacterized protein involved in type VI secretion and phage assembly